MAPVKTNEYDPNRTSSQDSINDFLDKSQISSSNDIAAPWEGDWEQDRN